MIRVKTDNNDEMWEIGDKIQFLRWMKYESAPVPDNDEEMQALMRSWLRHYQRERAAV